SLHDALPIYLHALAGEGFLLESENNLLASSQEFLWKVRYALHMLAGRAEDRLLFDHQRSIAALLGFTDDNPKRAIEQFMQQYYRVHFEEVILADDSASSTQPLNPRFQLHDGYIEAVRSNVFKRTPFAMLEIFHRHLIDDEFRNDIRNTSLFIELFKCEIGIHRNLRRMNRYGILGRYLPEFGLIVGQMQHDLFHIYTVDAHTLNLIKHLRKLQYTPVSEKFPLASKLMGRLPKPELIYLAGLYHDIGKGRQGDHSEIGARKDLSDPQVIHDFAQLVGDLVHLDYLYVLTVADINATNPSLWNSWRASLLRQLYTETKRALRRGLENPLEREEQIRQTQSAALDILVREGTDPDDVEQLWSQLGDD
uniref:HD domain-containing protein n=1 Tax=Steinernema glaseri TaxID=37863 RepID=A0A1I8AWL9_9BILA